MVREKRFGETATRHIFGPERFLKAARSFRLCFTSPLTDQHHAANTV